MVGLGVVGYTVNTCWVLMSELKDDLLINW